MQKTNWHALKLPEVFEQLGATKQGLTDAEVKARQIKYGLNILPEDKRPSVFSVFGRQMRSPLVYVLLIAALITAVLREFIDMGVILAAVVVNATIGFWQEWKADEAFSALKAMVTHKVRVMRRGLSLDASEDSPREIVVDASEIVPGDILLLHAGDRIAADARLLTIFDFEANEAALTGESLPIKKHVKPLPSATMLAERLNMVFQGTTVARGKAEAVVVATGKETAFGEIAMLVHTIKEPVTPLQKQLQRLAKLLGLITVLIAVSIFVIGALQGRAIVDMFLIAVAVAVAAIPEGLLISLTVILAIGMRTSARRKAIVKRLIAAETLGSVTVICSDKTGTLTTGEMAVAELTAKDEKRAWEIAIVGNEATDPTSRALLAGGSHAGFDPEKLNRAFPKLDEVPFDSAYKWAATLHKMPRGRAAKKLTIVNNIADQILYVRGAPEKLIEASKMTAAARRTLVAKVEEIAHRGMRVVAVAYREVPKEVKTLRELVRNHALPKDLVFAGIFGLKDPLRPRTKETIALARSAGIRTIMITGDHAKTAAAIGAELGLLDIPPLRSDVSVGLRTVASELRGGEEGLRTAYNSPRPPLNLRGGDVLTGAEMDELDDSALNDRVGAVNIFARVLPKHKVRIVDALHSRGETLAMTGDGVNDAPALKAADIGVAVGSGTDVAKEAADVVLTDNNLETIVGAVEGGRNIYENIKKVVAYLLSDSWTEIIVVAGSLLLGLPLPLLAAQILWVNLIEDSLPNMALAFDPGEPHVMREKPRPRSAKLIDSEMKVLIFGVGITTSLILFALYWFFLTHGYDLTYTRTVVFVGLGINSLFYIYSIRSLHHFIWQINPFNNKYLLGSTVLSAVLLVGAVYAPPLQHILRTAPLAVRDWMPLVGLGVINIVLIELVKAIFITKNRNHA